MRIRSIVIVLALGVGAVGLVGTGCGSQAEGAGEQAESQASAATANLSDFVPKTGADNDGTTALEFAAVPAGPTPATFDHCDVTFKFTSFTLPCQTAAFGPTHSVFEDNVPAKARAYLRYVAGGADVPTALRDSYWTDTYSNRKTATRLCWLREGYKAGHLVMRPAGSLSICGKSTQVVWMKGTLASSYAACSGTVDYTNSSRQVRIIARTIRADLGHCNTDDRMPTFFQVHKNDSSNESLLDPEPAALDAGQTLLTGAGATATAHGTISAAAMTVYRLPAAYVNKASTTSNGGTWESHLGEPCVTGTASVSAPYTATQVLLRQGANYVRCGDCGTAGKVACPAPGSTTYACDTGYTCSTTPCVATSTCS